MIQISEAKAQRAWEPIEKKPCSFVFVFIAEARSLEAAS